MEQKISFSPLWEQLTSSKMTQRELQILTGLGSSTFTKLRNNECVTTETILKLCVALNCDIKDIIKLTGGNNGKY